MIKEAYISGKLGEAIYIKDDKFFLIEDNPQREPIECDHYDYSLFFSSGAEYEHALYDGITIEELRKELSFKSDAFGAMTFLITGMNAKRSDSSKELSIRAAEKLLANDAYFSFARKRLLSCLLPEGTVIDEAIVISRRMGARLSLSVYEEVLCSQPVIRQVREVWDDVAGVRIANDNDIRYAEGVLFIYGIFADFVHAVRTQDVRSANLIPLDAGNNKKLMAKFKEVVPSLNVVLLLTEIKAALVRLGVFGATRVKPESECDDDADPDCAEKHSVPDRIESLIRKHTIGNTNETRKNNKRQKINRSKVKDSVDRQIYAIQQAMSEENSRKLEKYIYDISQYNLNYGDGQGRQYLAKTYCNLATYAMGIHKGEVAERLLDYAALLDVKDAVIWTLRAEYFIFKGLLDEALVAYDKAVELFPRDEAAHCGRAEVLRALGRLDEALVAYDKAVELFPRDEAARCGRAEVLRALGRLDEALTAYDKAVELFPRHEPAHCGRAEVLRALGRLDEALTAYDKAVELFPRHEPAHCGRAEVLRALGRLDEALVAYDKAVELFPRAEAAHCGRAGVLLMLKDYTELRKSLPIETPVTKGDWIGYHIVAMSYIKEGNLDEAIRRLQYGADNVRWPDSRDYFVNALGFAKMKLGKHEEALKLFKSNIVQTSGIQQQLNLTLIGHCNAEIGRLDNAIAALNMVSANADSTLYEIPQMLRQRYNLEGGQQLSEEEKTGLDSKITEMEFMALLVA
ncbi:MAG: tetratricopeptide repeat protein [Candidatus Magnetobacterium sp. LHC-1]